MGGPRGGGTVYSKRGSGRVSKHHGYSTPHQPHHAQAAANAYQQQQQQLHQQQQQQKSEAAARTVQGGGKFGEDADEVGGLGDELDLVSLREAATVRYLRYNEWMELITTTALSADKFVMSPETTQKVEEEVENLYIKPLLERQAKEFEEKKPLLSEGLSEKVMFFKEATEKLREEFNAPIASTKTDEPESKHQVEEELKKKYNLEVIDKFKITPIRTSVARPSSNNYSSSAQPSKHEPPVSELGSVSDSNNLALDSNLIQNDLPDTSMQFQQFPDNPQQDVSIHGHSGYGDDLTNSGNVALHLSGQQEDLNPDAFISLGDNNDLGDDADLDLLNIP